MQLQLFLAVINVHCIVKLPKTLITVLEIKSRIILEPTTSLALAVE